MMRGFNDGLAFTPDGKTMVFDRMSVRFPNEIYVASFAGEKNVPCTTVASMGTVCTTPNFVEKPLTHINAAVLDQVSMQPLESFWFAGAEDAKVQGFVVKPPDFDAKKKYPVKFLIHGGPQGAWGDDWSYRWNPELFAANGYVVIMVNPRGSTGYGQKFIDDINGDWGGPCVPGLNVGPRLCREELRLRR